jgi:phosphoglycerate kinase
LEYKSIFDEKIEGKTVLLRADLNSNVVEGRVIVSSRLREHSKTIYALAEEGAKVVVLSHQGRKGSSDYIELKRHSDFIKKFTDKKVKFVKWKDDYVEEIRGLQNGEIVVLDNTRFLDIEQKKGMSAEDFSKETPIKELAEVADYFVQDALSICHRAQATVIGFGPLLPCYVGPVLERELEALEKIDKTEGKKLLVLGGAKPEDSIKILDAMLEGKHTDEVCVGGIFGELFLKAKDFDFGTKETYFEKKGFKEVIPQIKELLEKHKEKITLPIDLAQEIGGKRKEIRVEELPAEHDIFDIGTETTELFKKKIRESNLVVFNGPMGVYEKKAFMIGTKKILETIAFSRNFSILGGGDTETALAQIGLLPQDFGHVSLAGKALLAYLAGKKLAGLEILSK